LTLLFRRIRRYIIKRWEERFNVLETPPSATTLILRRMARARKLVTSLNRLLASKSEVITQIRKRLLKTGAPGSGNNSKTEGLEVAIYMGDVQGNSGYCIPLSCFWWLLDHILTLQHSLNYYERMLSESHPIYLSQLRTNFVMSQSEASKNLVFLTSGSIAVLCMQALLGELACDRLSVSSWPQERCVLDECDCSCQQPGIQHLWHCSLPGCRSSIHLCKRFQILVEEQRSKKTNTLIEWTYLERLRWLTLNLHGFKSRDTGRHHIYNTNSRIYYS